MKIDLVPFSELLDEIVDNRGRTCPTADSGIPLIATNCIRNETLYPVFENIRYVSQATYSTWFKGHPKPGDIIFVNKGTPGRVCLVPDPVNFCVAQDMVAIRANQKKVYPKYLFAVLRSPEIQDQVEQMHVGTLIPHFKKGDFNKLLLPVHNWEIQKSIGDFYFNYSAKIELNRRMNRTLEAMAQALFKSWFVDFDPVMAKSEGRVPFGMSAETAALFPVELVEIDSEHFPLVPKGWKIGKVGDIGENVRRGILPDQIDPEMPYIGLEHMPRKNIALSEWGGAGDVTSNKFLFKKGEILFGKLHPYFHKVGVAAIDGVCSTDILIVNPKDPEYFGVLLGHLTSVDFINYVDAGSEGTKMPRTNWEMMARYPVAIPEERIANRFTGLVNPMVKKIHANIMEARTLASIRDALLPRLLSGEIRIKPKNSLTKAAQ